MDHPDLNISCSCEVPPPTRVSAGDKVTFRNNTGADVVITFKPKSVFKEDRKTIKLVDQEKRTLTVSKDKKKATYSWDCPGEAELTTRTGTIDPS